ncbi:glycosyl hydrolases family 2, TIM barrel domain-containing protein [Stachybotrys elegans]|uniref:beta-galactosidase n=1 Tax=Stachybotrys elegans TaxID=80388 RepID=A0A8K0WUB5_9HYPO|nr:glycosyl hydrolases family 2, TIM barrel domain-containing protein [Stachybotrys elegans]
MLVPSPAASKAPTVKSLSVRSLEASSPTAGSVSGLTPITSPITSPASASASASASAFSPISPTVSRSTSAAHPRHSNSSPAPDWNNIKVIHRNALTPRSHFYLYDNEKDALTRDVTKAKAQCLSGTWKFHHTYSPFDGPVDFYDPGFDASAFSDIPVPSMWQLHGHGKGPHYTNVPYPWPVDPPNVPFEHNECGRYITRFTINDNFTDHQLRLRFEGVDSSFSVWVNGNYVGYSQGSRNPSEFDITKAAHFDAPNTLAVEVYQRCDGSYLEDQDQWWLSGIFRDVYLHAFPKVHPLDFHAITQLDEEYKNAALGVKVSVNTPTSVELKLLDPDGALIGEVTKQVSTSALIALSVHSPYKWTAETPILYTMVLNFLGEGGCSLVQRVGFRSFELLDGVFCVNGKPIKIRGANRHEHHPDHGRAVPYEFMKQDLLLMKRHNINAIRTSHQLNDVRLYDLADELGFWVLDEADLECHGFNQTGGNPTHYTSDNPDWKKHYVDRARQLVARDKNHACVFMWSLGNEAFYGQNHQAMYDTIKSLDPTRLVHYEGDRDARTADIFSRMYSSVESIIEFAREEKWNKPLVLCEFLHAMGNGPGNCAGYLDAMYLYPRLMGGFIWEWANHGLRTKTEDGEEYMGYGGDFGDVPNDGNFIMDGVLFSNHTPTPGLLEYAKAIEPIQTFAMEGSQVTIVNRYDFLSLDHVTCTWDIVAEDQTISGSEIEIPMGIEPHTAGFLTLDGWDTEILKDTHGEVYLNLTYRLREATNWAPAGHIVATGQVLLLSPLSLNELRAVEPLSTKPTLDHSSPSCITVVSANQASTWSINLTTGLLSGWKRHAYPDVELITKPITMDFYRALTDNDRKGHGRRWIERRVHQTQHYVRQVKCEETDDGIVVEIVGRIAPPVLAWAVDVFWTYHFRGDNVTLRVRGRPHGLLLPRTFARIGITAGLAGVDSVRWWGRGPGESYRDKKFSQLFGKWESTVDDLWVDYEFPQDGGNRTDVRHVEFVGANGRLLRARFGDLSGASFSAMHYTTEDIDKATHPHELRKKKRDDTIIRLDWAHHGLGTGSCGPVTLPEHTLRGDQEFDFELILD